MIEFCAVGSHAAFIIGYKRFIYVLAHALDLDIKGAENLIRCLSLVVREDEVGLMMDKTNPGEFLQMLKEAKDK